MTYFLAAFIAGLFGLGMLNALAGPRHRDPNREFYDNDANWDSSDHCDYDERDDR